MPEVFNALPGIEVPVGSFSKSLQKMWSDTAASGGPAPSAADAKATQLNLVLHLGFSTTPEDGCAQFQTALKFAHRSPCRIVVLCPQSADAGVNEMRAKIYGECFLGKSKGDTRCIEFVALSYPVGARQYLESQVSVCLSTDLPLYYWAHRFSDSLRLAHYQYLLRQSKRVIFDTALVPPDALTYPWPRPEIVRDLAYARLLPVRQSIGQYLSRTPPATLVEGLQAVKVGHAPPYAAEAQALLRWLRQRLADCGAPLDERTEVSVGGPDSLSVTFVYGGSHRFHWRADFARRQASFESDFGGGSVVLPTGMALLAPEAALSEAMFF